MISDAAWMVPAGRVLIVAYYLLHILHDIRPAATRHHIGRLAFYGVPFPPVAFWLGIALELTGCVLVLTGWHADIGIYCLIVFTVVANGIYNRYWTMDDPVKRDFCRMLLGANTAVLGGLLLLLAAGR